MMPTMVEPLKRAVALEDSPEAFWERFSVWAVLVVVYAQPTFSPLIEVQSPVGMVYVFDRGLSPLPTGEVQMLLHGQVDTWQVGVGPGRLSHLGGGRYEAVGQVKQGLGGPFFVLEIVRDSASLPLLIASPSGLELGQTVQVQLRPPLMAFRHEGGRS